jgi:RNA ligase
MWNDVTMKCRGLIYNHNSNLVVSRPPVKFWNINDPKYSETSEAYLSTKYRKRPPFVVEKLDGSMGILWSHSIDGGWTRVYGIATRGSFESEQAQWATAWLRHG